MDIEMFGKLSDAFGPSGFEEDVIRTIADYCKEFDVENLRMPYIGQWKRVEFHGKPGYMQFNSLAESKVM